MKAEPEWRRIVHADGTVSFPRKGQRVRIKSSAEWVSLAGAVLKAQVAWLPVEGVVVDVQGVAADEAARAARIPSAVEFTVRTDRGDPAVVTLPMGALGCVEVQIQVEE